MRPLVEVGPSSEFPEACDPYASVPRPVRLIDLLARLSRDELEDLALRFYGREPARFEQIVLALWAAR